jgi:hypothetical protein
MVGAQDVAPLERPARGDYCTAWVVVFLIVADLCLILAHLLDDRIWSKAYMHYSNKLGSEDHDCTELETEVSYEK